jgi:tetratricopeptide (TPR) repeat protein
MIEEEYIKAIKASGCEEAGATIEQLRLADEAVKAYPHSARLWCLRGQLIQVGPENGPHDLSDALDSLLHSIKEDNEYAEGYEEVAYFYDAVEDNPALAESYFRRAIELGGSVQAYVGLARVLAELGRAQEVVPLLQNSPYGDNSEVVEVLREIDDGLWRT